MLKHLPQPGGNPPAIYVSQDGAVATVTRVIEQVQHQLQNDRPDVAFTHLRHKQERRKDDDHQGYSKLSRHFGWALNQLFLTFHHPRVIILEDDLEVAPDFFQYFNAVAPLLDADPTLLGATAWNDIGQPAFVHDPHTLYRSDFFGGLGWMLNAKMWAELGPKWPTGYWDDWLREPPQRQGRAFIRPEVSRSYTFGKQGVSGSQFFDRYLGNIKLNNDPQTWTAAEVQQLARAQYDPPFLAAVNNAVTVSVTDAVRKRCSTPQDIRVLYNGFGQGQGYVGVARVSVVCCVLCAVVLCAPITRARFVMLAGVQVHRRRQGESTPHRLPRRRHHPPQRLPCVHHATWNHPMMPTRVAVECHTHLYLWVSRVLKRTVWVCNVLVWCKSTRPLPPPVPAYKSGRDDKSLTSDAPSTRGPPSSRRSSAMPVRNGPPPIDVSTTTWSPS